VKSSIALATCLGLAFLLGQSFFYEPHIVPRLASSQGVPWQWWLAAFLPEIFIVAIAAFMLRGVKPAAIFCAFGALCVTLAQWVLAAFSRSGTSKVIEGGAIHFLVQFAALTIMVTAAYVCLSVIHLAWSKVGAG
jgi:hypothetical protein